MHFSTVLHLQYVKGTFLVIIENTYWAVFTEMGQHEKEIILIKIQMALTFLVNRSKGMLFL